MHIVLLLIFLTTVPAYAQDSGLIGFEGEYALADDDTPVSVIVLFEHGPVAVQLYEAGVEGRVMPFGLAERLAADDHVLFRAEISALFGVGGYGARARTAAPFSEAVSIDRNAELARQFFANQEGSDDAHVERALGATDAEWRKSDRQDGVLGDGYSFSIDFEYRSAINGVSVTLPSNMVHALAGFDSVRAVFPDVKILPPEWDEYDVLAMAGRNPQGAAQGRATKRADEMHEMGYRGEGILVAVIDTGIYRNHAAFAGAFPTLAQMQERNTNITEGDTIDGIFYGRNFVTGIPTNNPSETHNSTEHGTHVAGIVAGRDSGGSQSVLGVAPDAQIIAYRVMGATGGTQSVLLAGINQTAYDKPDVVVMSLGVRGNNDPAQVLALAVNNITFAHPYITFVLAAGNDGPASSSIASPASAAKAITVGSVTLPATAGGAKTLTASSSRGPLNRTFEISPDVLGHGANVLSALPPWSAASGYGSRSGTSMAAPHIAGAVALMKHYSRENFGTAWTAEEVKTRLMNTATPLSVGSVFGMGAGYIDIFAAAQTCTVVHVNFERAALPQFQPITTTPVPPWFFGETRTGSFSFGGTDMVNENVSESFSAVISNRSNAARTYTISYRFTNDPGGALLNLPESITVPAHGSSNFTAEFFLNAAHAAHGFFEGFIYVSYENETVASLPFSYVATATRPFRHGDINGDGRVTSADATLLARWLAGHRVTINRRAADINCNGEITIDDLTRLAQVLIGVYQTLCPQGGCARCA